MSGAPLPIVLVGLPGAGKTKVGRILAQRLGVRHIDTDDLVQRDAGAPPARIFHERGEPAFRALEARAVLRAVEQRAVVSLGGGAPQTPAVREALRGLTVIHLDVAVDEALRRMRGKHTRPLLAGDARAALLRLRREREAWYREVESVRVHTDARPAEQVALEVLGAVEGPARIRVDGPRPYDVVIGRGLDAEVAGAVRPEARAVLLVHPSVLAGRARVLAGALRARGLQVVDFAHPDAEAAKTVAVAARAWDAAGAAHLGRQDAVVGLGGGATTDLAGFVAACWLRGVQVVQAPTTVLGMVDAALGGKTGVNTPVGKNLVGAFHQPARVVADLDALATAPTEILREGLGEVVKCGYIADPAILSRIEADPEGALEPRSTTLLDLIRRCVAVKAGVVAEDPRESGRREILNYGHTLGHAIERCEGYRWRHGQAVAVGCAYAAELAADLGMLAPDVVSRQRRDLDLLGLPATYSGPWGPLREAMRSDKKARGGVARFVLLEGVGLPVVREVRDEAAMARAARKVGIDV